MTDFVHEHLNKLNNRLLILFQKQEINLKDLSSSLTPIQALDRKDVPLFLTLASRDIDLINTPNIDLVYNYLALYSSQSLPNDNNNMDWLFISKCIVVIYGDLIRNILNSTLPLSESIQYWNSIYGSKRYEAYYGLQTLPIRIGYLGLNTLKKMRTTHLGLKTSIRFDSPEHFFLNMFPMHAKELQQKILFNLKYTSNIFHWIIHEEISEKLQALNNFRIQQASRLGLLIKLIPFIDDNNDDIPTQSIQSLNMMKHILISLSNINSVTDQFHVNETLDYIESCSNVTIQPIDIAKGLLGILNDWNKSQSNILSIQKLYAPPSILTRYWIPAVATCFMMNSIINIIDKEQDHIIQWLTELSTTIKDFAIHWVWDPILQVWDTIRLKEEKLTILGKENLKSDIESLERMVSEFARDKYHVSNNELDFIVKNVKNGDMSIVLKAYENEIKHPLKSVIRGDLIQTLLIQVQKTKVDMDLAMNALDKLLKSNELNFAFLAVAPSMLITWGTLSWLNTIWKRRNGRNIGLIGLPIRRTMRRIERLFNLSNDNNILDCQSQGILLCEVHLLRSYSLQLPLRNSIRELFMEDLRDLENPKLTVKQKLEIIDRMFRSWYFLKPSSH